MHRYLDRAALHHCEQRGGDLLEALARGGVRVQGRPGRVERALLGEDADVEGVDRTRGGAEAGERAEWLQAIERGRERRLADAVIDHLAQRPFGDLLDARGEILVAVED